MVSCCLIDPKLHEEHPFESPQIQTHMCVHINVHIGIPTYTYRHEYINTCMYIYIHVHVHIHRYMHTYVCMYINMNMGRPSDSAARPQKSGPSLAQLARDGQPPRALGAGRLHEEQLPLATLQRRRGKGDSQKAASVGNL